MSSYIFYYEIIPKPVIKMAASFKQHNIQHTDINIKKPGGNLGKPKYSHKTFVSIKKDKMAYTHGRLLKKLFA